MHSFTSSLSCVLVGLALASVGCQLSVPSDVLDDDGGSDDASSHGGEQGHGTGGDGGGSQEARLCDRVAECGYLGAGYTVGDCTDIVSACTNELLTSAHADWNTAAEGCLSLVNCQNFGACFADIDVCIWDVDIEFDVGDGGGGDGGDGGGSSADSGDPPPPPPSDSGGDGGGDGSSGCTVGEQACVDDQTIEVCTEDGLFQFDCLDVCIELGWEDTYGCGWDDTNGVDICWCG